MSSLDLLPAPQPEQAHKACARNHLGQLLTASVIVAGSLMQAFSDGQTPAHNYSPSVELQFPAMGLEECPPIPPDTLSEVQELLNAPEHPVIGIQKFIASLTSLSRFSAYRQLGSPYEAMEQKRIDAKISAEIAKDNGLTIHDPLETVERWTATLEDQSLEPLPFHVYLGVAQEFAEKYGVQIRPADKDDQSSVGLGFLPPRTHAFENKISKQAMIDIIQGLGELPVEYLAATGLKSIVLYEGQKAKFGAFVRSEEGEIAVPLGTARLSWLKLRHELGHLLFFRACGSAPVDAQFTKVGNNDVSHITVMGTNLPLYNARQEALAQGDKVQVCNITDKIRGNRQSVGAFTEYGATNDDENKAEGMSIIGTGALYVDALQPGAPPRLSQRAYLIFGRLFAVSPSLARYFAQIMAKQPSTEHFEHACSTGNWKKFDL